ncbi:hypothetical protein [Actinomadura sp. 9N407]|uniref:hypothetical protein n=1 Tax=Actinomadura sp. 9N407 TaxID=3375154 RepID=UPI00378CD47D
MSRGSAVLLAGVLALGGCGGRTQGPETGESSPSRVDPQDGGLVLRWRMTGGIAGLGGPGSLPEFSLYGDGRAIVKSESSAPVTAHREYQLKPGALRRLLDEARAAGLDRSRTIGSDENIADAMTLVITMGEARTRVVQPEAQNVPAVRFWKRLDPKGWPQGDQAAPAKEYRSTRVAALAGESPASGGQRVSDWPVDRSLGEGERVAGGLCTVYTGEDRDTVVKHAATGDGDHRWRSGGKVYSVRLRPMLPEERTCEDVART